MYWAITLKRSRAGFFANNYAALKGTRVTPSRIPIGVLRFLYRVYHQ